MYSLVGRSIESLRQVARGLGTVFKHINRYPITKEFPDTMPVLPGNFRGRLALAVNPQTGDHLCISCLQCERVCPDKCIQITSHKSPETNKPELIEFKIDHGLCMFCGLCTEVCPTNCIINTNDFEMSDYDRASLIYDLKKLTLTQDESRHYFAKKELPMPKPKPVKPAAKPAAAAAAKPAPDKPAGKPEIKAEAKPEAKPDSASETPKPQAIDGYIKPTETRAETQSEPIEPKPAPVEAKVETKAEAVAPAPAPVEAKAETKSEAAAPAPAPVEAEPKLEKIEAEPSPVDTKAETNSIETSLTPEASEAVRRAGARPWEDKTRELDIRPPGRTTQDDSSGTKEDTDTEQSKEGEQK